MSEMRAILDRQQVQDRMVAAALKEPGVNVLLYGPPGTGKSTAALFQHKHVFTGGIVATNVTLDTPAALWIGFFVPKPVNGGVGMEWVDGIVIQPMGLVLDPQGNKRIDNPYGRFIINDIHNTGPDIQAVLYAVCDDRNISHQVLPNGDTLMAQETFQVVATSNEPPEGLEEPIKDRFSIRIHVDLPSEEAIESLPDDLQEFALKCAVLDDDRRLSYREIKMFANLRERLKDPLLAAQMVWDHRGEGAAEEILNSYQIAGVGV